MSGHPLNNAFKVCQNSNFIATNFHLKSFALEYKSNSTVYKHAHK